MPRVSRDGFRLVLAVNFNMERSYLGPFLRSLIAPLSPPGLVPCLVPFDRPRGELARSGLGRLGRLLVNGPGSKEVWLW